MLDTIQNYQYKYVDTLIDPLNKNIDELDKKIKLNHGDNKKELEIIALELLVITLRAAKLSYDTEIIIIIFQRTFKKLLSSFETIYKKLYPTVEYKPDQIKLMIVINIFLDDSKNNNNKSKQDVEILYTSLVNSILEFLYMEPVGNKPEILAENKSEILVRNKYLKYKYKYLALKNNNNI